MRGKIIKPSEGRTSSQDEGFIRHISNKQVAHRKKKTSKQTTYKKIEVAEMTIRWGIWVLSGWGFVVLVVMLLNGFGKLEVTNEIHFISPITSGIINIIMVALGAIVGTRID